MHRSMAVSSVANGPIRGELPHRELPKPGIQPPTKVSDDNENGGLRTRIRALVGFWESLTSAEGPQRRKSSQKQEVVPRELWRPFHCTSTIDAISPPPSYEDCVHDLPPDYTATDSLAYAQCLLQDGEVATNGSETRERGSTRTSQLFGDPFDIKEGFRQHAKKKAKKAAAAAQKAKWADSDDEEKKEEGAEGEENGGGDSNGGGDAGGGDAPGGGDEGNGGDDDWWNDAGGKKKDKKKKKKSAWEVSQKYRDQNL